MMTIPAGDGSVLRTGVQEPGVVEIAGLGGNSQGEDEHAKQ
ncbi:MAG TPA: hypothetical protein VJT71_11230 [Pyrinomonadaceae bacterium]|nr:hypothetical protein [Pyrinomonadaceae bacterium]